jgi:DNA polymerase-3 subunit alpha
MSAGYPAFSIDGIALDDPASVRTLFQRADRRVFQFESSGMRQVLVQLGPEHMEDLIAVTSLYRPGPMESIPRYISNGTTLPGACTAIRFWRRF